MTIVPCLNYKGGSFFTKFVTFFIFQASAYLDKFITRKEDNFIRPILNWEKTHNASFNESDPLFVKFVKFVKFIIFEIESNSQSYGTLHWWPFTNICGLCNVRYDFIGKVETWTSDIENLSEMTEFKDFDLSSTNKEKFNQNTKKSKEDISQVYFKQLNQEIIIKLYNIYKSDFFIGGYKYPQSYIDSVKNIIPN